MAPRWTVTRHTDDQGKTTETPLTPQQLGMSATGVGTFLITGKIDPATFNVSDTVGHTLVTSVALTAAQAAVDQLLNAANRAGKPITTSTPVATIRVIATSLGDPQWY
jgi:hypothetical protein